MEIKDIAVRLESSLKAAATAAYEEAYEQFHGDAEFWLDHADDVCESEIEKIFLLAWIIRLQRYQRFGSPHGGESRWNLFAPGEDAGTLEPPAFRDPVRQYDIIKAQFPASDYRCDFAFRRAVSNGADHPIPLQLSPKVIVECDGHDFHERTKEQAARDKERDRFLQTHGFFVLRFTGSEIWRDPEGCAQQLDDFLEAHLSTDYIQRMTSRRDAKQI